MMPESLLSELEQTAQRCSVREALMLAYFHGKSDGLGEALQDVTRRLPLPEEYTIMDKIRDEAVND